MITIEYVSVPVEVELEGSDVLVEYSMGPSVSDILDNLTEQAWTTTFVTNVEGQLTDTINEKGDRTFNYNPEGQLIGIQVNSGNYYKTKTFEYAPDGTLERIVVS